MNKFKTCFARVVLGMTACCLAFASPVLAEEFYCEVMAMEGTATVSNQSVSGKALQEGEVLKVDDAVDVAADSYVDLAFDREWNNVARLEENTKVNIRSIYPTTLELNSGGIFAKLKQLPKESSFDVQTPTAIASVRGTEYRTTFVEGETQIYNVSNSDVYVYGLDDNGQKQSEPVVLKNSQKTQIQRRGAPPAQPLKMEEHDFRPVERARQKIESRIKDNVAKGRMGRIQDVRQMENSGPPAPAHEGRAGRGDGALTSLEGGQKPPRRGIPTLSAEDAERAAKGVIGGQEDEPTHETERSMDAGENSRLHGDSRVPDEGGGPNQRPSEHVAGDLGSLDPDQIHRESAKMIDRVRNDDGTGFDQDKLEKLKQQVNDAPQNSSPEQRKQLEDMQQTIRQTVERVARAREESSGQPFGPDPGRRPKAGSDSGSGQDAPGQGGRAAGKPAPRSGNHP